MNRGYYIDRAWGSYYYGTQREDFHAHSFYGSILSRTEVEKILESFNIATQDMQGNPRHTNELILDLRDRMCRTREFSESRVIGDAIDSLIYSLGSGVMTPEDPKDTNEELDSFLGTFKIIQGGVSL